MQHWNETVFLAINAAQQPGVVAMLLAQLAADGPVVLPAVLLAGLWIARPTVRAGLIATGLALFAGQAINWCAGRLIDDPRPFMAGVGHTWIEHTADNGFPSDHATPAWALGLGLILSRASRAWGLAACAVGVAAGWARIYLGVHFPLDMLGSAASALLAGLVARAFVEPVGRSILPTAERLYAGLLRPMR